MTSFKPERVCNSSLEMCCNLLTPTMCRGSMACWVTVYSPSAAGIVFHVSHYGWRKLRNRWALKIMASHAVALPCQSCVMKAIGLALPFLLNSTPKWHKYHLGSQPLFIRIKFSKLVYRLDGLVFEHHIELRAIRVLYPFGFSTIDSESNCSCAIVELVCQILHVCRIFLRRVLHHLRMGTLEVLHVNAKSFRCSHIRWFQVRTAFREVSPYFTILYIIIFIGTW